MILSNLKPQNLWSEFRGENLFPLAYRFSVYPPLYISILSTESINFLPLLCRS